MMSTSFYKDLMPGRHSKNALLCTTCAHSQTDHKVSNAGGVKRFLGCRRAHCDCQIYRRPA